MNVIQLTRLRHEDPFFVNPDLIERVDTHVDTVIRLTTGSEYIVSESAEEIIRRIADFRARIIALAGLIQQAATAASDIHPRWPADWATSADPSAGGTHELEAGDSS